ncbi:MAG: hypothetical protein J3K34DRAFT_525292 [Monoraphidium minutum]|nr:MAG: hypothetical protein J3K34DRAFT_525292 [Monoraphidium minutum]
MQRQPPPQQHEHRHRPRHGGRRPSWVAAAGGVSGGVAAARAEPDFVLRLPSGGAAINVFGVEHLEKQPHIGEWILRSRPAAVVVETACHPGHGAWPGNVFTCDDQEVLGTGGSFFQRMFCQVAAAMKEQGAAAAAPGGVWQQAAENFNGEQLAYVAALTTGAKLAFGDRPKEITYRRLFALPTAAQIDEAFAAEVLRQYLEVLGDAAPSDAAASDAAAASGGAGIVDEIMMREREAVMCRVAADMAAAEGGGGGVALVVGSAHLPGIKSLWDSGAWAGLVGGGELASSPLMSAPSLSPADMAAPGAGARRGMLDAVISLSVTDEVLQDLEASLPAVPDDQSEERQLAFEFYSAQRTQLAALPRAVLERACGVLPGHAAGGSMWDVLAPLRAARPVNGGRGWDLALVEELRALDVFISTGDPDGGGDGMEQ